MPDIARRRVISASPSSPAFKNSPPFEELGSFDEESCRYFLREVGARVVPSYPFNFGMEEVYSLILERFGYPGIPDVTSVLQELLESEGVAGGFGDDGDIWRSWRHSWKHRNDDALNPFIPKIGNFILQAPTEPHIRRIKAQNFIRKCEKACAQAEKRALTACSGNEHQDQSTQPCPSQPDETELADTYILPAMTYSHQRTRTLLASGNSVASTVFTGQQQERQRPSSRRTSTSSAASSQQDFIEVDPSNLDPDIDPSLLISFEMLTNDRLSPSGYGPILRGGHADLITLQQIGSPSRPTTTSKHDVGTDQASLSTVAPGTTMPAASEAVATNTDDGRAEHGGFLTDTAATIDNEDKDLMNQEDGSAEDGSESLEDAGTSTGLAAAG